MGLGRGKLGVTGVISGSLLPGYILMFSKLIVQELFGHVIWKDNSSVKLLSS